MSVAAFIEGVISAADEPALHSTVANLVQKNSIAVAISSNGAISFFGLVIGPAVCGYLLLYLGEIFTYSAALLLNIIYLIVWFSISTDFGQPPVESKNSNGKPRIRGQLKEALNYIVSSQLYIYILVIFVNAMLVRSFYYTPSTQSGYYFDNSVMAQSAITASIGVGLVLGAVLATYIASGKRLYDYSMAGFTLVVTAYLISPFVTILSGYVLLWVLYGIGFALSLNLGKAALQAACEDEYRGRVSGVISYLPRGTAALSTPIVGGLILYFGLTPVFLVFGCLLLIIVIILWLSHVHRSKQNTEVLYTIDGDLLEAENE